MQAVVLRGHWAVSGACMQASWAHHSCGT